MAILFTLTRIFVNELSNQQIEYSNEANKLISKMTFGKHNEEDASFLNS